MTSISAHSLRIPEIAVRDRFLKRALQARCVFTVSGEDGLARTPSQRFAGREATFVWSSRAEAERWAALVATNPRIKEIALAELLDSLLPALAGHKRLIALDWSADTVELELDPLDLAERLRLEAFHAFLARVRETGSLWLLEDSCGPALLVSATRPELLLLPCWSQRDLAESRIEGPWANMVASEVSVANFLAYTLPWLEARGWLVGPEHLALTSRLEIAPGEISRELRPGAAAA